MNEKKATPRSVYALTWLNPVSPAVNTLKYLHFSYVIKRQRWRFFSGHRHILSTGPSVRGHIHDLTSGPPSLAFYWPRLTAQKLQGPILLKKVKFYKLFINHGLCYLFLALTTMIWCGAPKIVSLWPGWGTNFLNLTTSLYLAKKIRVRQGPWKPIDLPGNYPASVGTIS